MELNSGFFDYLHWTVRGSVLRTLGQHEQAIAAYDKAIELQPNSSRIWTYRGLALQALKREDEAIASFFKALKANPNYYEARAWLDLYLLRETSEAEVFKQTIEPGLREQLDHALMLQERAIQIEPSSSNWLDHADLLRMLGKTEEALNSCSRAIQINPNNFSAWSDKGKLLEKLQRYEEALDCFNRAIQIKPDDQYVWRYRSDMLEKLQRHEEAITAYRKTAQLEEKAIPEKIRIVSKQYKEYAEKSAYLELGKLLEKAYQYEEAIAAYRRVRRTKSNHHHMWVFSWFYEANLLQKLEQHENLLALFSEWLEAAETAQEKYDAWMYQGDIFNQLEQWEKAFAAYNCCIEIDPGQASIWVRQGDALCKLQRWQEALEAYDRVIIIEPAHEHAISKREQALKQLDQ